MSWFADLVGQIAKEEKLMTPTLPVSIPALPPRRVFSDQALQGALDRALLAAPDSAHFAVVAHADLKKFVAVARYDQGPWSLAGFIEKEWRGDLTAGAELRFSL